MESGENLGGLNIPATVSGQGTSTNANSPDNTAAGAAIAKRRGRPPGSGNKTSDAKPAIGVPQLSAAQFAQLYSPELWGRISSTPADAMAFATGNKKWEVSPEEKKALGESCSIAAQCFAVSDPRYLAAAAALITLANVYGMRLALMFADKRKEEKEKQAAKP